MLGVCAARLGDVDNEGLAARDVDVDVGVGARSDVCADADGSE